MGKTTLAQVPPLDPAVLQSRLQELVRGEPDDIAAYLIPVGEPHAIADTKAVCRCYSVAVDDNGNVGVEELVHLMVEHAILHAIPRKRIIEAYRAANERGNPAKLIRLQEEAKEAFTDLAKTGEGGELLLFLLTEFLLGIPQILCKMDLKTATGHHYNGCDGVHAEVDPVSGSLMLWWGESKIFKNATAAITDCFKSLAPFLVEPSSVEAKRRRDMLLLRDHLALDNPRLEEALKRYFDRDKKESRNVRYCGVALVGFDCDAYPADARAVKQEVEKAVAANFDQWHGHIGKRVGEEKLSTFDLHVICVPFPSAEAFRKLFLKKLGFQVDDAAESGLSDGEDDADR